ncbi:conserved hypothetical protein [Flavobacterium sp. 9AF]|uniref:hypothetical protein n=1 Tax=Flavobacterium sp. 9AF TaxID=2653142 RepID=UPI0012EF5F41|nr:hypothetical protein [Flavobacterium sp. 9AF]VXB76178.1 conserved hypothetical protein [Flavobacterium sp. 9AF]
MRIAKYIFLLILLLSIAFIVFIATQPNEFTYKSERTIKTSKNTLFQFINDYKNWNHWYPELNTKTKISLSEITTGEGAFISWDNSKVITTKVFSNDSIYQLKEQQNDTYEWHWKLEEIKGETKVTWQIKGKLSFNEKLTSFLKGGNEFVYTSKMEQGLENITNYLVNEISNYAISINGITKYPASYYIQQKDSATGINLPVKTKKAMDNVLQFVKQNDIVINGNNFIQYFTWNFEEPISFAACIPIEEEILTTPLSDITGHFQEEYSALKITLKGSYYHRKEAWDKGFAFIKENQEYALDLTTNAIKEIYKKDISQTNNPSEFITEILIPVKVKNEIPKPVTKPTITSKPVSAPKNDTIN